MSTPSDPRRDIPHGWVRHPRERMLITPLLHQNVEDDAVLIHRSPQPVTLALDLELHLVQMNLLHSEVLVTSE